MSNELDFIQKELLKLKDSTKTKDRLEYLKTMKGLLAILKNWNNLKQRDTTEELIKQYQEIIDNYSLYYYLRK